jgi:addiction module HigA family antidote
METYDMSAMHNPPHPGEVLKELYLEPLGLTVTETARALGLSRKSLSALLNGRAGVSPDMAMRLARAFETSPESWLNLWQQYALWKARQRKGAFNEVPSLVAKRAA